jgi:hypothetical protein
VVPRGQARCLAKLTAARGAGIHSTAGGFHVRLLIRQGDPGTRPRRTRKARLFPQGDPWR